MKKKILSMIMVLLLVAADQFTKYLTVVKLKPAGRIPLIDGVFSLQYVENNGAAFGILQNQKVVFVIMTLLIAAIIGYVIYRMPDDRHYTPLLVICTLLLAGAAGNFTDRILHTYVIDFLYFEVINFPVFNVADCYVTISAVILFFLILFFYQEEDFSFLSVKSKISRDGQNP